MVGLSEWWGLRGNPLRRIPEAAAPTRIYLAKGAAIGKERLDELHHDEVVRKAAAAVAAAAAAADYAVAAAFFFCRCQCCLFCCGLLISLQVGFVEASAEVNAVRPPSCCPSYAL